MIKLILPLLITLTAALAQNGEVAVIPSDIPKNPGLKIGDIAPSWALMSGPGKFEFLKTWTEEKGKKLRKPATQPDRHVVLMSFFATWCKPCMKELPHLQNLYEKYKNEKIKFFLIDITEATRTVKGWEDAPKAGPFLAKKGITIPILYDSRGVAKERYGAMTLPRLYIVGKYRTIQLAKIGFDENEDFEAEISAVLDRLSDLDRLSKSNKSIEHTASIPTLPPDLALGDIQFTEPSGNNYLDAEETGTIIVDIMNNGMGAAISLQPIIKLKTDIYDLKIGKFLAIGKLSPKASKKIQTTVTAGQNISSKTINFEINVSENNGFDLYPPGKLTIQTKALVPPALALMDVGINDLTNYNGRIEPNEVIEAMAIIQNRGQGLAKNVNISVHYGDNVFNAGEAKTSFSLGNVQPNETKEINFSFFANRQAETDLPIRLEIKEARGRYDQTMNAGLSLNEVIKKAMEVFVAGREQGMVQITNVDAISVDIEKEIPKSKTVNKKALAVIFGIENYKNISAVTFAKRDATYMKEYFEKVLGIPGNRIYFKTDDDVGRAEFEKVFSEDGWLDKRVKEGKTDLYIYYAGHGAPDIKKNKAYLIPYDGDPNYASQTGYEMDKLYEQLGSLGARSTTVFLDACFSGANRDNEMLLADARPVFMEVDESATRDVTVFSAAGGKEISSAWPEKKHGLFSYFLMKGMRGDADANSDKKITVGELGDYVKENVSDMAGMLDREQTPGLQTMDNSKVLVEYE
jgi:thiol-disulfide isomerase/thioredoxin